MEYRNVSRSVIVLQGVKLQPGEYAWFSPGHDVDIMMETGMLERVGDDSAANRKPVEEMTRKELIAELESLNVEIVGDERAGELKALLAAIRG